MQTRIDTALSRLTRIRMLPLPLVLVRRLVTSFVSPVLHGDMMVFPFLWFLKSPGIDYATKCITCALGRVGCLLRSTLSLLTFLVLICGGQMDTR
eukprot:507652-Amphidinium_carterae.1